MTDAGRRDVNSRIEEALNRLHAGHTLWWTMVSELDFEFEELPLLLSGLWDNLPADQRPVAVAAAWTLSDPPEACLPTDEWLKMFRAVGYIEGFLGFRATPPDQITLWRGGTRKTGMSWSADRGVAVRFQNRFDPPGKLWTATVKARYLLGYFNDHRPGEQEYVVDPAGLAPTEVP